MTAQAQRFGGRQNGRSQQQRAFQLLAEATEAARAWTLPTKAQRDAVDRAVRLIGEAADALSEAIHMDTIDLDEDDR